MLYPDDLNATGFELGILLNFGTPETRVQTFALKTIRRRGSPFTRILNYSRHCEQIRSNFENREAISIEKGALRVRIRDIQAKVQYVTAQVEEIPTPGLGVGLLQSRDESAGDAVRVAQRV